MTDTHLIRLTDAARFTLGRTTVTPAARTLASGVNESVIEPRVMQVLVTLYRQCGEVVGREALIEACWGQRTVGEDAVNRAILKLRRALDLIGSDVMVETVAKVGYRLCAGEPSSLATQLTIERAQPRKSLQLWVIGVVVVLAACLGFFPRAQNRLPPSSIVAVQPLRASSTDAPARRLSQDFASDLSRVVLGHDDRLELAGPQDTSPQTAAFTLTGSAASIGRDLHAVVMLSKPGSPAILWSHDYTMPLDDADGLRQQIGTNVAAVLVCALGTQGLPETVDDRTTSLYLETCTLHAGDHRREAYLLRQVIAHAPHFAGGWADLAISLALGSDDAQGSDVTSMQRESHAAAMHALSINPSLGRAYFALALLLPGLRNWMLRERIINRGLAAQPDCPQLYNVRAHDLAAIGRQQDSIDSNRRAVALDPLFPGKTAALARALADAGRGDEAADTIRHMREVWPDNRYTWSAQFETAARIGDAHEAEAMLDDTKSQYLSTGLTSAWRSVLQARQNPIAESVQRAVQVLMDQRRQNTIADDQLIEGLVLLGRSKLALNMALNLPPQPESAFWFRSFLRPLRADRRFMTIAKQQGLYTIWRETGLWPDFCHDHSVHYDCRTSI